MAEKDYKKITMVLTFFFILFSSSYLAMGSALKEENKREILNKAYTLQIPFIENKGQIKGESVSYYAKTFGGTVFITKDGKVVYSLPKFEEKEKVKGWVIKEGLVGASISNVKGEHKAVTKVSYFKGKDPSKWERNISTYNLVSLGEVYKGIELKVKAYGKNVEKLFYVKAGANPENIKIKIEGAKSLRVNEAGELEVETGLGVIKFTKPSAYQEINGKRVKVAAAYTLLSNPQYVYSFKVGSYDKKETLIIDPLLASTFIGGSSDEYGNSIALDGDRNVYITGGTYSSNYPTTSGAYDESFNGGYFTCDVFVSKLNSNLSNLLASTFIGGSDGDDYGYSIALDGGGNVYITGYTYSSNYPTTSGAYDESLNGDYDVFVSRLDSNLSAEMEVSGDLDGDGDVDYVDFNLFLDAFGKCEGDAGYIEAADFDKDGCINCADYQEFIALFPEAETSFMSAVEYAWGDPAPGYSYADWPIFEGWMNVRLQNTGTYDAEDVTATVLTVPINTEVVDGEVTVGDIPAGASAWSTDTFRIRVDMSNPVDPDEGIFWKVEYDANGEHIVEVVPEFPGTIFCAE